MENGKKIKLFKMEELYQNVRRAKYVGYWRNNKACGKGKLYHSDGDLYDGYWLDDKPNGYGVYLHSVSTKY